MFGSSAFSAYPLSGQPSAVPTTTVTTTAWLNPSTVVSSGWTNPTNIYASDNAHATTTILPSAENGALFAYGFAGLSVPSDATILGIEFRVEAAVTSGNLDYNYFFITRGDSFLPARSTLSRGSAAFGSTDTTNTIGGLSDLWGGVDTNNNNTFDRAWLPADFDSQLSLFVGLGAGAAGANVSLDNIQLRVRYTQPIIIVPGAMVYTVIGYGSQSFTPSFRTALSYTNTGTGSQTYALTLKLQLSYTHSGTGSQSYAASFKTARSYTITGTGTQTFVPSYYTSLSYTNTGSGTQSYTPLFGRSLSYEVTSIGEQSYTISGTTPLTYENTGLSAQNYTLSTAQPVVQPMDGYFPGPNARPAHAPNEPKRTKISQAVKQAIGESESNEDADLRAKPEAARIAEAEALRRAELEATRLAAEIEQLKLDMELARIREEAEEEEAFMQIIIAAAARKRRIKFQRARSA